MKRRRNPDDEGLLARLSIRVDDYPAETRGRKGNFKQVNAYEEGVLVARFLFKLLRKYAEAKDVAVIPDLQRRGVASWLYRWVERKYGVKVIHSKDQTTDGRAFARGRRNPAGKQEMEYVKVDPRSLRFREPDQDRIAVRQFLLDMRAAGGRSRSGPRWPPSMPPIIIHNGEILDGHHRVAAAIKANLREIPAVEVSDSLVDRYNGAMEPIEMAVERWLEKRWGGTRKNPDDRELLGRLSLTLEHHGRRRIGDGRTLPVVDVKIYDGSRQVGAFLFARIGKAIEAVDAYVNPSLRRRGVASWVYREVGRHFGTTVRHSKLQLEAGKAFAWGRRR